LGLEDTRAERKNWSGFQEQETILKPTTTFSLSAGFETSAKQVTNQSKKVN
jgi:hypothetical protein